MRALNPFYFALIILLQACIPTGNPSININGNIQNNSNYCGGAAPSQEMLDQLAIYRPSANQTFYIRQGILNRPFTPVYKTFTTDANGLYTVILPVGNYAVITQEKFDMEHHPEIDSTCTWLQAPDFNLNVVSTQQVYNKQYTQSCSYVCLPYQPL